MKTLSSHCLGLVMLFLALSSSAQDCNLTDPQTLPWVQDLIATQNCSCNEYLEHYCYENESIFILSFTSPFCLDYPTYVYDANGNQLCSLGGLIGGNCDNELPNLANSEFLDIVWSCETQDCICTSEYNPVCGTDGNTYGNACEAACAGVEVLYTGMCNSTELCGAKSVYDLPWLSTYINDCHYDAIYAFEYNGQQMVYVQHNPLCEIDESTIVVVADLGNVLFDCEGNVVCLDGGFTTPESQCSFQDINISSYLINDNLVWTPEILFVVTNSVVNKILLGANIYLQGAYTYSSDDLMRDELRLHGLIPLNEPYAAMPNFDHIGGETIKSSLLNSPGPNAIVDWVLIELRDPITNQVLASRSALLQRDGDAVDLDGISPVAFTAPAGEYVVCIRHRNHLCVVTQNAYNFNIETVTEIDFSNVPIFGQNPLIEMPFNKKAMWGGCPTANGVVAFQGPNNTPNHLFFEVINAPENTDLSANFIRQFVYNNGDLDMDGKIIYQGANSDVNFNFFTIIQHPMNTSTQINYTIVGQEP